MRALCQQCVEVALNVHGAAKIGFREPKRIRAEDQRANHVRIVEDHGHTWRPLAECQSIAVPQSDSQVTRVTFKHAVKARLDESSESVLPRDAAPMWIIHVHGCSRRRRAENRLAEARRASEWGARRPGQCESSSRARDRICRAPSARILATRVSCAAGVQAACTGTDDDGGIACGPYREANFETLLFDKPRAMT